MAKIIEKTHQYAGVVGKIFNTMDMDSDLDAPSIGAVKDYVKENINNREAIEIASIEEFYLVISTCNNKELNITNTVQINFTGCVIPEWSRWFIPQSKDGGMVGFIIYPDLKGMWAFGRVVNNNISTWHCKQFFGNTGWIDLNPTGTAKYRIRNGNTVEIAFTNFIRIGGIGWVDQLTLPVEIKPNLMLSFNLMTNNSNSSLRMSRIADGGKLLVYSPTGTDDPLLGYFTYGI